jgi:surfactin synthase thioesterase subunit
VNVLPIQLPGRENRALESAHTRLEALVAELSPVVQSLLGKRNVFFGYSMGAWVAFEIARELRRRGRAIDCLFVAAAPAPHLSRRPILGRAPDDVELVRVLRALGGTPEPVLADVAMMDLLLPTIRADFSLLDEYRYRHEEPLRLPIHAFAGLDDAESRIPDVGAWTAHTSVGFEMKVLPGGHFFIHSHTPALIAELARTLRRHRDLEQTPTGSCVEMDGRPHPLTD